MKFSDKKAIKAQLPDDHPPVLLVIIDTEEEFDWSKPFARENTGTTSILSQSIAHERVFDRFGVVPTYVIDWPVATTPASVEAMRTLLKNGQCEIGTHLHPWVSPPYEETVTVYNSYAGNLPKDLEFEKLRQLTEAITQNFGQAPRTFKAGRYGLGPHTLESVARLGYKVDASIVPYSAFTSDGGPDFTKYTEDPFWFGEEEGALLELPVTTAFCGMMRSFGPGIYPHFKSPVMKALRAGGIAARTGMLERIRLTPEGCSFDDMRRLASALVRDRCKVMTLTYHSPSVVPGHTPYVRSSQELDSFLSSIRDFCTYFRDELGGVFMSVNQLHERLTAQRENQGSRTQAVMADMA